VAYSLDLDIGEVAPGYHLIARTVSLSSSQRMAPRSMTQVTHGKDHLLP
jgi:hypothetical protein